MSDQSKRDEDDNLLKRAFGRWFGLFLVLASVGVLFFLMLNLEAIYAGLKYMTGLITPVLYGAVIAYILNPFVKMYKRQLLKTVTKSGKILSEKKEKATDVLAIVLAMVTGILLIIVLFMMIIPQIAASVATLIETLPAQIDSYYNTLVERIENNKFLADTIQEIALQAAVFLDEQLTTELIPWLKTELLPNLDTYTKPVLEGITAVFNVLYNLLIGLIVAIYLLNGRRTFLAQAKKIVYGMFKKSHADIILYYVRVSNEMFSGFISGKIVDSAIIGLICFVAMSIMQLPYALLVSVMVGVTNVIPVFGPFIGAVPSAFLILLESPLQALYFIILIIVLQQLDGNVIGPAILGESTGLSAFWVLFSILFFGGLWGIFGMLIGCPLFAVIYRIIRDYIAMKLKRRKFLPATAPYLDLKQINISEDKAEYVKYSYDELYGGRAKTTKRKSIAFRKLFGNKGGKKEDKEE